MVERDEELEELQRNLRAAPYIEQPDDKIPGQGAMCFLNKDRLCGPDCAAYIGELPTPPERCQLISAASIVASIALRYPTPLTLEAYVPPAIQPPNPFGKKP